MNSAEQDRQARLKEIDAIWERKYPPGSPLHGNIVPTLARLDVEILKARRVQSQVMAQLNTSFLEDGWASMFPGGEELASEDAAYAVVTSFETETQLTVAIAEVTALQSRSWRDFRLSMTARFGKTDMPYPTLARWVTALALGMIRQQQLDVAALETHFRAAHSILDIGSETQAAMGEQPSGFDTTARETVRVLEEETAKLEQVLQSTFASLSAANEETTRFLRENDPARLVDAWQSDFVKHLPSTDLGEQGPSLA